MVADVEWNALGLLRDSGIAPASGTRKAFSLARTQAAFWFLLTLVSYAFIYLFLTGLTYLFQQNFATQSLLDSFAPLDKAWTGAQSLPLLLFFR